MATASGVANRRKLIGHATCYRSAPTQAEPAPTKLASGFQIPDPLRSSIQAFGHGSINRWSTMIPIRDTVPSRSPPVAVNALIAVNVVVFAFELSLPDEELDRLF